MTIPPAERERGRPTPEDMLARMQEEPAPAAGASSPGGGRLRIFLGAAPGVGKTYAMLTEARNARRARIGVVVGFVETYGRPQTAAQLTDLAIVPRKPVRYGGIVLEEIDTPP